MSLATFSMRGQGTPRAAEPLMKLAFVTAAGQSLTDYAVSSVGIVSSLGESEVGLEIEQPVGAALRRQDSDTCDN
jgi:hypothetical protein